MGAHINDDGPRSVLDPLRVLVRALRVSARESEKHLGISGAQLFVLESLRELGPASVNALAAATHTDQSSVSVVVSRLAAAKLVARRTATDDGRRSEVSMTTAGRRLLGRAPETPQSRMVRALAAMPPEKRAALAASLGELAIATGLEGKPKMFFEDEKGPAR